MTAPVNSDLPLSNGIPGTYVQIDLTGSGSAKDDSLRRALILGYSLSSGAQPFDTPLRSSSVSEIQSAFGAGSDVARMAQQFLTQLGPGAADLWLMGTAEPSGGAAARYEMVFYGPATAAGSLDVWICGYKAGIAIANGDTNVIVAAALKASIDLLTDLPVTAALATTTDPNDTVRLTYRHKGAVGEDMPIRVKQTSGTGIVVSPGSLTFATVPAAAGNVNVKCGATTVNSAVTMGLAVNTIAANVAAAINSAAGPLTATNPGAPSAIVRLIYGSERDVRRVQARVVKTDLSANDTTVNAVAAGAWAYIGTTTSTTPGSGTPTLTTALTNLAAQPAMGYWVTEFNDTTTLGTLATHIATYSNGYYQKGQCVHFGCCEALATAGAIPAGTSPALTATLRFSEAWQPDSPQQACELAAHAAALDLDNNYIAKNLDGAVLKSKTSTVPLLLPHYNSRPTVGDQNSALMTYFMTPIIVSDANELVILRGRTTSNSANGDLWEWSSRRQLDYGRIAVRQRLTSLFTGKSFKNIGTPHTPNTITATSVKDAIFVLLQELDDQDLFDGAESVKDAIQANQNATVKTRIDVFIPWNLIRCLHQLAPVIGPQG